MYIYIHTLHQFREMEYLVFLQMTFIFLPKISLKSDSLLLTVYQFNICR